MTTHKGKQSLIYQEMNEKDRKKYFSYKKKKFMHNIDSLYFTVKVANDWNDDAGCEKFREYLKHRKYYATRQNDPFPIFNDEPYLMEDEFQMLGLGSAPYNYDITKPDKYTIFIMDYQLNGNTPELWVQLRSENLWLYGDYRAVSEALADIESFLGFFGITIKEVRENRIDFAYHTNYIQDPTNYFKPENMNKIQQSNFRRGSIEFDLVNTWDTETDYVTLGRKKSNNLFFRVYDKTKEVIQKGYKQFFIELWHDNKLISTFDRYCIEKAFLHVSPQNEKYLDVARLEFYLEHGLDQQHKKQIYSLLNAKNYNYLKIIELADELTPPVTQILNVEIETKRKFYYSMDKSVDTLLSLKSENVPKYAEKLYVKIDNRQMFHDYLTCNNQDNEGVIRFINHKAKDENGQIFDKKSECPTSDFWKRLQMCKVAKFLDDEKVSLVREYQKSLDIELMKRKINNMQATLNVYLHQEETETSIYSDVVDHMSMINENDIQRYKNFKRKKFSQLKNRLGEIETSTDIEKKFQLVDLSTGELMDPIDEV